MNILRKIEPTLIIDGKNTENKISTLEKIKNLNDEGEKIKQYDLKLLKIGLYGENQILYELLHSNIPLYLFHDVHYELNDREAQIDFIVVTEYKIFVIECKNIIGNIILNSDGSFIREYYTTKEGMYSPLTQNQRHIDLLIDLVLSRQNIINKLLNKNIRHFFESVVVFTNPKTIIKNKYAPKEIKSRVIRADAIVSYIKNSIANKSKIIDIESYARFFEYHNTSINKDFTSKYDKYIISNNKISNDNLKKLKDKLVEYRTIKSKEEESRAYLIFTNEQLEELLKKLPMSIQELKCISGFGDYKIDKFGNDILKIIKETIS